MVEGTRSLLKDAILSDPPWALQDPMKQGGSIKLRSGQSVPTPFLCGLLVERLGQNLPVGELDGKAEQQAFGRGASIACRSARSVTPGAGGTYLSSKVETGEKNEL